MCTHSSDQESNNSESIQWSICQICRGTSKINKGIRKKVKLRYQRELLKFEQSNHKGNGPIKPKGHLEPCNNCHGSGLVKVKNNPESQQNQPLNDYPHVAIIGGGIGGVALAVACLHRDIPFTLYERDVKFTARAQGYGLTLQQASREIQGLGISGLKQAVISTRHVVHDTHGKIIGDWGVNDLDPANIKASVNRTNIHISRQSLRSALIEQLGANETIKWGHQLLDFERNKDSSISLRFEVGGQIKHSTADLVVGADGIRSCVRKQLFDDQKSPLKYLGCIVILGICQLDNIQCDDRTLLNGSTVFQSANGKERIYIMPYDEQSVMWQLSFPMHETEAKILSAKGALVLKQESLKKCQWHDPIPQILKATQTDLVSGYPVYDRELLQSNQFEKAGNTTLIGDAAHPMSPFKGQGANQALLDALALGRAIKRGCRPESNWREKGIRETVLKNFESEMIERTQSKVVESAKAAQFLHSDVVLVEANEPRGRCLK
ncbi:FAD-dependent oxidoreductase [Marinicellulosiphila megalodicopiae]|uniref:FAD-dependent oxidoreductase n=1 Tax=Marinicellulosiphila megalodicopiae TaxID=2724896 RepID=UPI003BAFDD34